MAMATAKLGATSEREIFNISGPFHLTAIDWTNPHHRRYAAASLVQAVYILERDRHQKRKGPLALAPPWWQFFHFQLVRELVDDADLSIFGAIFQFASNANYPYHGPPRYVVAFRGTITKPHTRSQDLKLDLHCVRDRLDESFRFHLAMEAVENTVSVAGASNVWLAGHSLGSSIALQAGKNMFRSGYPIETYLFNPPFISIPLERIKNKTIKNGIRFAGNVLKAGVAVVVTDRHQRHKSKESFASLSGWIPYLFLNPADPICSEYLGYFEHRAKMMEMGSGKIATLGAHHSLGSLLKGSKGKDKEPLHLVPSAYLTVNESSSDDFKAAHGIHQWWKLDMQCQFKLHQFKPHLFG